MSGETQQCSPSHPSLPGNAVFGNAPEYYAGRLKFLERVAKEHGDLVRYRIGCDWHHFINDPREVREVLRDWDHIDNSTSSGEIQFEHSFIGKPGRARVAQRSISHSAMCPRAVASIHDGTVDTVEGMLDRWADGQERDVMLDMMRMNVEVVSVALFGRPAESWLTPIMPALTDLQMVIGAYTTSQETRARIGITRRREVFIAVEAIVEQLLTEVPDSPESSVLAVLRRAQSSGQLSTREVVHDLCVLLLAIPTTAAAAAFTWLCLSRHPEVRSRLEAELDTLPPGRVTPEGLERLEYLQAVLKESMRVLPPVGVMNRRIEASWVRGSLHLPAGEFIHICPYLLHRHPRFWREPEQFRPERFEVDSEWHHPEQELAYFPFGFGVRRCIGDVLAWQQLQITIVSIARRFQLEVAPDHEPVFDVSPVGALYPEALRIPVRVCERRPAVLARASSEASVVLDGPHVA